MNKLSAEVPDSNDIGTSVLEKDPELKEPPQYQVILINDDYTPMEFVVYVLQSVFNHNHDKATEIMMSVHTKGKGVCGIFSKEYGLSWSGGPRLVLNFIGSLSF